MKGHKLTADFQYSADKRKNLHYPRKIHIPDTELLAQETIFEN